MAATKNDDASLSRNGCACVGVDHHGREIRAGDIRSARSASPGQTERCRTHRVPAPATERGCPSVAGDSIEEIDRVIRALENVRDMMRNEGERVSREIAGYASLSHAAATAMKVIADSIHQWKDASDKSGPRPVS